MLANYVVNARFVTQPLTGIQRYSYELTRLLSGGRLIAPRPALLAYGELRSRLFVTGGYLTGHPWEQFALPRAVPPGGALFSPAGCGPVSHGNHVVTIHDLTTLDNPQWYSRGFAMWYAQLLPALARRARKLITVSQFCKRRIMDLLTVPDEKVVVAGEAAAECFQPRPRPEIDRTLQRFGIDSPYFLAVGAISGRKNLPRLLAAWKRVRPEIDNATFAIVGKPGLRFAADSTLQTLPEGAIHLPDVSDMDLSRLYSGAAGLLYPSLYEGFGLPILEAMACGCPVMTSNCTAMPEVAGDAAILVDPLSEDSIAEGIRKIADPGYARELRQRGFEQCRTFSWQRTATIVENTLLV
jgi:glycosyltransferase involved in cell wall biosynthesis